MIPGVTTKLISHSSGFPIALIALLYATEPLADAFEQLNPCVFELPQPASPALTAFIVGFVPSKPN